MTPTDLQKTLSAFAADRLSLLERHEAGARVVANYDFNNAYQYVINREETHVTWLQDALTEAGISMPASPAALPVPAVAKGGKRPAPGDYRAILEDDARQLGAFVERWRPKVAGVTHARNRTMLDVILGESLEHKHLFDQAAGGFEDLLGKRTGGVARQGIGSAVALAGVSRTVTPAAIALGSNLGDRARILDDAVSVLGSVLTDIRVSTFHETEPVGVSPQPRFLNAAVIGHTTHTARDLLDYLLHTERQAGRTRPHPGAARTLDLDLILFGDVRVDEPGLSVPHPRFRERLFVLAPLAEIAADWVDPVTGLTVGELLREAAKASR